MSDYVKNSGSVKKVRASVLPTGLREEMGLAPDAVVELRPETGWPKPRSAQEIAQLRAMFSKMELVEGDHDESSVAILRSLRDGREGRAGSGNNG